MRRHIIIASVLVAAVLVGLGVLVNVLEGDLGRAHEQTLFWRGKAEAQVARVQDLTKERDVLAGQTAELAQRVAELTRKRRPVPPAPDPVPDEHLQRSLVASGISPTLLVADGLEPRLNLQDARMAWSWAGQAARIPAFEERVAQDQVLLLAKDELTKSVQAELKNCDAKGAELGKLVTSRTNEAAALRKENDGLVKVQVAERYRTKIVLGVTLPAAAYLGWRLGRK